MLFIILLPETVLPQGIPAVENSLTVIQNETKKSEVFKIKSELTEVEKFKRETRSDLVFKFYIYNHTEKTSFNFLSSINSNISFGGFWERYAILNFTPNTYIKPVSFISISANRSLSCFVEIKDVKQKMSSIILQGVSMIAIDNVSKIFLNKASWISEAIIYTAKNLLINLFIKPSANENKTPVYESFYYSVRINF